MSLAWGEGPITRAQAEAYAHLVPGASATERATIAEDLAAFPLEARVRGVFFEGLSRVVTKDARGTSMKDLFATAGVSPRKLAFSLYPMRDLYRIYFLAARALDGRSSLADSLESTAHSFYPIFRQSMLGKTMSVFIGSDPKTLLARLADAYNLSVPWNEHTVASSGDREMIWRCKVEPSTYYRSIFTGIVAGAATSHDVASVGIDELSSNVEGSVARHVFRISW